METFEGVEHQNEPKTPEEIAKGIISQVDKVAKYYQSSTDPRDRGKLPLWRIVKDRLSAVEDSDKGSAKIVVETTTYPQESAGIPHGAFKWLSDRLQDVDQKKFPFSFNTGTMDGSGKRVVVLDLNPKTGSTIAETRGPEVIVPGSAQRA